MKVMTKPGLNPFYVLSMAALMNLLTPFKLCMIAGSSWSFFTLNQCLTPVIGFFIGTPQAIFVFLSKTLITIFVGSYGLSAALLHIPTLFGTLYITTQSRTIKCLIPLTCILLFVIHPVGATVAAYTLYWVPPVLISCMSRRSIFLQALASTLTTHAVGTIFWLYMHSTHTLFWTQLLSVVWIERLLFALSMTAAYYAICLIQHHVSASTPVRAREIVQ